jgi:uncharacterized repeat protein (TIGR01451 family)
MLLAAGEVTAAMRVTGIEGREAVIQRGTAVQRSISAATTPLRPRANAVINVSAGADTDAANNDFRRIQDAINAAIAGDSVVLSGTFDFTAPFAAAAWAAGNDNTPATADDFSVYVPAGKNNITLTAASLGSATIQGPGDLPAVNLESFIVFDGGDNQGWTISNLRILDFDLGIGMFFGAGGTDAFNFTLITNNLIRIPVDLNATAAPADTIQNIGIHYAFGIGQIISGNVIQFTGGGVSAGSTFSSHVGMQSNTSGGAVYDGLQITGNQLVVLAPQSANPETILGIWENAHGHTSNISVSNNTFTNPPGNDPALNLQRAFRVTSHSSATTVVMYSNNQVDGVNTGFQWLAAQNFAGNQAVVLTGNTITNSATGVLVQSNGAAHLFRNTITGSGSGGGVHVVTGTLSGFGATTASISETAISGGSADAIWIEAGAGSVAPITGNNLGGNAGFGLRNEAAPAVVAERNWWGNNLAAAVAAEVSGTADFDPWLASGTDIAPATAGFQAFGYATTSGTLTTFAGTAEANTGALLAGDPVTMQMNGDTAFTPLAQLLAFDIQLDGGGDFFTLGQTGIPTVLDGGAGADTLIGTNVAQTWNVSASDAGNIPGATSAFSAIEALRGGSGNDSFVFGFSGNVTGTVDGGLGVDSLDNSAVPAATITPTGPGSLDGFMGTASGVGGGFDNINLVAGSPADLSVTKTGPATADVSSTINYTITVNKGGPNPAVNVSLSDPLPAGTTFLSLVSPGGWTCSTPAVGLNGTITCSHPSLPAAASPFQLNVTGPAAPANLTNTVTVTSANESAPGNESASANTAVGFADLSVTKTAPGTASTGASIVYAITVTNNGPHAAASVSLTDALPAGTTFVSLVSPGGWSCGTPAVGANGTVTCTIASLPAGANPFTLTVNAPASPGAITNTATAASANEGAPGNESASAPTTIIGGANLVTTKSGPSATQTGSQIAYTIGVTNNGPDPATNLAVTDVLPAGVTFVSATPSQGSCSGTTTVTCNLGTLANASTATIALVVTVTATSGTLTNTASADSTETDPTPADATASSPPAAVFAPGQIPTASFWTLLALILTLGAIAVARLR